MRGVVVVDGYNLLGVRARGRSQGDFMTETAREQLIRELSAYHQRLGHAVTVVFDGWRTGLGTEQREFRSGVEIVYSKRGEKADEVIARLARERGEQCAVVSSDREVAHAARTAGAFVLGAGEFALKLAGPAPGIGVAAWRKDDDGDRRPSPRPEKKGNPRKLPKAIRARRRKLKGF